ncbi:MAG: SDR family NAD(P)-dependent oxidoreductase [Gemmatimonadota bacterium]
MPGELSGPQPGRPVAVVTGASSGIGRELAVLLAAGGFDLILAARRAERLRELARQLSSRHGAGARAVVVDLAEPGGAERVYDAANRTPGGVQVLVNNAGIGSFGPFADTEWARIRSQLRLNIEALTRLTHLFVPDMVRRRAGRILNVASTAAFQPGPRMAVYYASKAYELLFSEALAEELRGTGVTVTTLCPGPTRTEFQDRAGMGSSGLFRLWSVMDAARVAEAGYRGMLRGKRIVVPGTFNRLTALSPRFLPRRWMARLVGMIQAPRGP